MSSKIFSYRLDLLDFSSIHRVISQRLEQGQRAIRFNMTKAKHFVHQIGLVTAPGRVLLSRDTKLRCIGQVGITQTRLPDRGAFQGEFVATAHPVYNGQFHHVLLGAHSTSYRPPIESILNYARLRPSRAPRSDTWT